MSATRLPTRRGAVFGIATSALAAALACPSVAQASPRVVVVGGGFGGASCARALKRIDPDFVSVTYGAGGTTRDRTAQICDFLKRDFGFTVMPHLTCVGHTRADLSDIADRIYANGFRNIMTLRGDPPKGETTFVPYKDGLRYASDLAALLKSRHADFCLGVGGYPEGHPQCLNRTRDLENLKRKVDNGGCFVITQLFFDNTDFYRWRDTARTMGIKVPVIAGIMPILNINQMKRFISMCGAKIPHPLLLKLESLESNPEAVAKAGIEYATRQCQDLLFHGVDGVHFYTLNKSKATVEICRALDAVHAA